MTLDECYRTLGLEPGAGIEEVKKAYRAMAKAWHPDRYTYTSVFRQRCEAKMKRINEAYQVLREHARKGGAAPEAAQEAPPRPRARPAQPQPAPPPFRRPRPEPPPRRPEPEPEPEEPETSPAPDLPPEAWLEPWRWRKQPKPKRAPFFRWRSPKDLPDAAGLNQVGYCFGLSIMAFVAYFLHWNHRDEPGYAEALRIIVSVSCLYGAYFSLARMYWEYSLFLVLLAAVLNPLVPVYIAPLEWRAFTLGCPVILVYIWFSMRRRESNRG